MSDYKLIYNSNNVIRNTEPALIPADPGNRDWQIYQVWLSEGNIPDPADTPLPIPQTYTFLQFLSLFTPTEQAALVNSTDPQVKLFNLMAAGAGGMQLNNAEVVQGVNYVASVGIIANTRITAILAGQAPS
jgi:hypothetical protein